MSVPLCVAGIVLFAALASSAPDRLGRIAAKEGPVEHISHAVLVLVVLGFTVRASRPVAARGGRAAVVALAVAFAVVLAEELDWGEVYGLVAAGSSLARRLGGEPNLHNAWSGASYVLFGLPVLAVVALGLLRPRAHASGWPGPRRGDALALCVVAAASLATTLGFEAWERAMDEVAELLAYTVLAVVALRPARASATST